MPGLVTDSPAHILRRVLIELGAGSNPPPPSLPWPIYAAREPTNPDNVITIYNSAGRLYGITHPDKEVAETQGILVRVRSANEPTGYARAELIREYLDNLSRYTITVSAKVYRVNDFRRTSSIIPLGLETPTSSRFLYTLNGLISVREVL